MRTRPTTLLSRPRLGASVFFLTLALLAGGATSWAQDQAPVVMAPATATGMENHLMTFGASATDPDGDAITSFTAAGLPSGATFVANATNTAGTFSWTPPNLASSNPPTTVTFTAANALTGSASTVIFVSPDETGTPVVTAPPTVSGPENSLMTFTVTASTAGGGSLTSFTALNLPAGATFTANATNTSGTFSWTPSFVQAGSYSVTFRACNSLGLCGSSSTNITVISFDRPPVVNAPSNVTWRCGDPPIQFGVAAADPDGDVILNLTAAPLPNGATFTTNAAHTSGTFAWTPNENFDIGTYSITFTASNTFTGTATTTLSLTCFDRAPVVTAPGNQTGCPNRLITFTVSAADPDGDPITSLTAAPLPSGAGFFANASNTAGTFSWTPSQNNLFNTYNVTFTAANALSGSATTAIYVGQCPDRPPLVNAPAVRTACPSQLTTFTVTAADPDGEAITSLTAAPLPSGATFTTNVASTSGTFSWTPNLTQMGSYNITFTASNALSGSATTAITVGQCFDIPVVTAPASVTGEEGSLISFVVTASTQSDPILQFTAAPLPLGATFTVNASKTSGTFAWTPTSSQAGTYSVTFTASHSLSGSATTSIVVADRNRAPIADAGGPYYGAVGTLLSFNGTGSSDPDGDPLTYQWLFGDGYGAVGPTPEHVYGTVGTYTVTLNVSDATLTDTDDAQAVIGIEYTAQTFNQNRYRRVRFGSGSQTKSWCTQLQPITGAFSVRDIDYASIRLHYTSQISPIPSKGASISDTNADGIEELEICFAVSDLATFNFPSNTVVSGEITGALVTGGTFRANWSFEVSANSGSAVARILPNPFNPEAVLSFETTVPGPLRIQIFDISGRLVRTVLDEASSPAGRHDVRIEGRASDGTPLGSGIYFYRIVEPGQVHMGRFAIVK